jgi:hypothetical protein
MFIMILNNFVNILKKHFRTIRLVNLATPTISAPANILNFD